MYNKNGRLLTIYVVVYRSFSSKHFGMGDDKNSDYPKITYLVFLRCLISEFNRLSPCLLFRSHVSQWKLSVIRS